MSRRIILGAAAMAAVVFGAMAQLPEPKGPTRLEFRTIPVQGVPTDEHKVTPYRLFDKMVVTVWDPIVCGQKPVNPTFSLQGDNMYLSYGLTPAPADASKCTLVSEFDVLDVPHRDFAVHFAGGPEPYVIARVKKCPSYKPGSDDIWECLAPAHQ